MSQNNEAFLMKLGWGIFTLPNALWMKVLRSKYMIEEVGVPQPVAKSGDSPLWKGICKVWDSILKGIQWVIGNGRILNLLKDSWWMRNKNP